MDSKINGLSVILCCYNSVERIRPTLEHLLSQKVSVENLWEVVLVDNNSSDTTGEYAKSIWESYNPEINLKVVKESKPGLSFARNRGMKESRYNTFLFCDDDNWLQDDYIESVFLTLKNHPDIGALGGWSTAVFEKEKPHWFDAFAGNFAVGKPQQETGYLDNYNQYLCGAGLVLRKEVVDDLEQKGFKNILSDRKGKTLSSGGDVELIYAIKLLGVPIMFNDALFFQHYMPSSRMTMDYLVNLRNSMHWSNFVLGIYLDCLRNRSIGYRFIFKKIKSSITFIYKKTKQLETLDPFEALFLKNQIEVRRLFLKNLIFYCATFKKLKKIQHG